MGEKDKNLEWEEVSCEHIIKDEYIDFRRQAFKLPNGEIFEPYYSYSRRDYVVIVATDEDGNYICVKQYRQGIRKVTTEFCAGGIERNDGREYGECRERTGETDKISEIPLEAAKRELKEETGYESDEWKHLLSIPSNATISDNYAHIFMAKNCRRVTGQDLDDTEFLNVEIIGRKELDEMIKKGEFEQAVHILALLLAGELTKDD